MPNMTDYNFCNKAVAARDLAANGYTKIRGGEWRQTDGGAVRIEREPTDANPNHCRAIAVVSHQSRSATMSDQRVVEAAMHSRQDDDV